MTAEENTQNNGWKKALTSENVLRVLNEIYMKVNQGAGPIPSVQKFSEDYLSKEKE